MNLPHDQIDSVMRATADVMSALAVVGAILGFLPAFAAGGALIWYCVQIWESKTIQKWVRHRRLRRKKRHARKDQ